MKEIFQHVLEASIYGSVIILAVLLLRLLLRKAPRRFSCMLWLLVGLRLLIPMNIESRISLQPDVARFSQVQEQQSTQRPQTPEYEIPENAGKVENWEVPDVKPAPEAKPETGEKPTPEAQQNPVSPVEPEAESSVAAPEKTVNYLAVAGMVWILIAVAFVTFNVVSYLKLKHQVRDAVKVPGGWASDKIETAFILGYLKPQIYVPMTMDPHDRSFIMRHERAHLDKGDHWYKLVGFLVLSIHWFNPLVWVAYILLCRDIEMACDERVIRNMELADRKRYSAALLSCSANRAHLAACPVAFAEVSVKTRIQTVLKYKKPRFWLSIAAAVVLVFVLVCFLTNPVTEKPADEDILATEEPTMEQPETSNDFIPSESELVDYFQQLLSWRDNEPWYYNSMSTGFSSPKEISFYSVFGSGIGGKHELTDEEKKYLINQSWPEGVLEEADIACVPADKMNEVLNRYFGISLADTDRNYLDWFDYVPETDCYYMMHRKTYSDMDSVVVKVVVSSNEYDVYYYNGHSYRCMRLRLVDGTYQIVSDQQAEESIDIPHLVKDSCLTVFDYLPSGESVSTTDLVRTGFEKEINGVKISLPEIILDSEFARAFNSEMQEFGADVVFWVTEHGRRGSCYYAYEYDNVLSILVTHHASEFSFQEYMLYNFNLETGESMTAEDMRERFLGISRLEYLLLTGMAKYAIGHNTQIINDSHVIPPYYMDFSCWSQDYNFEGFDLMIGRNGMPVLVTKMEGNVQGGVIVSVEIDSDVLAYFSGNSETVEPTEEPTAEPAQTHVENPARVEDEVTDANGITYPLAEVSYSATDLVRTGYSSKDGRVTLPEIVLDTEFARIFNAEMQELTEYYHLYAYYRAYEHDGILSIVLTDCSENFSEDWHGYNFDLKTGEVLTSQDLCKRVLNIGYPQFLLILDEIESHLYKNQNLAIDGHTRGLTFEITPYDLDDVSNKNSLTMGPNGNLVLTLHLECWAQCGFTFMAEIDEALLENLPSRGESYEWVIDTLDSEFEETDSWYTLNRELVLRDILEYEGEEFAQNLERLAKKYDRTMVDRFAGYLLEAYEGREDTLEKLAKKLPNGELKDALLDTLTPKQDTEKQEPQKQDYQTAPGKADGYVHSYPLGTTVLYDLNGDGIGESIMVQVSDSGDGELTIGNGFVKGGRIEFYPHNPTGYYSIVNPYGNGKMLLVTYSDYGPSDDYSTRFYTFDGTNIIKIGEISDIIGKNSNDLAGAICQGNGIFEGTCRIDILGTWTGTAKYGVGSSFKPEVTDYTDFHNYVSLEGEHGWEVTNKVDLVMYMDRNDPSSAVTVPMGTTLYMIGCTNRYDNDPWVAFDIGNSMSVVTLWLQTEVVQWTTFVKVGNERVNSEEVFDGFNYAG